VLLGFQRRFESDIVSGRKRHTIRAKRNGKARGMKIRPRVGEMCHCYVDPRQKTMRLLGRWVCTMVQDIRIEAVPCREYKFRNGLLTPRHAGTGLAVWVDGNKLDADEVEALFVADGFPGGASEAHAFWADRLPFQGDLIHWRFD
jgi:hypothetical protein